MAVRLTRIYTRTGDGGNSRLGDGSEISKSHPRLDALGELDEVNAAVGMILAESLDAHMRALLLQVSNQLFDVGSDVCRPGLDGPRINAAAVDWLEEQLDGLNETLPPLTSFILPGGNRAGAACHLARTVCRRAERALVCCHQADPLNPHVLRFINRLSDLLFVCARAINGQEHELLWEPGKRD